MAEPDGIKVPDTSVDSVASIELVDGINDPPSPTTETTLDPSASPIQEVSDNELVSETTSISTNKSDADASKDESSATIGGDGSSGDGGSDSSSVVDATASVVSTASAVSTEGKRSTDSPTNLEADLITNETASADATTDQTTSTDLTTIQPTPDILIENQTSSDDLTTSQTTSISDVLIENQPTTDDVTTPQSVEPDHTEKREEETALTESYDLKLREDHEEQDVEKPGEEDERVVKDILGAEEELVVKDIPGAKDELDVKEDTPGVEDELDVKDTQGTEEEPDVDDKQGAEEDEAQLPPMESKLEEQPEVVESAPAPEKESLKEPEQKESLDIDQKDTPVACDISSEGSTESESPAQDSLAVATSDSPTDRVELQEKCESPTDCPVADAPVVPCTDACRAEAASPSAQRKVLSYATFKPIVPGDMNISDEQEESRSLLTAQDLPQLEDVSVDTSNDESAAGCISPDHDQLEGEVVTDGTAPGDGKKLDDVDVEQIRPPNPTNSNLSSESSDEYSTSSDSFKQRREPDGDCDFLDQTLNISAIETSMQYSESCATTDLPSLVMSTVGEQSQAEIVEVALNDAPGEVVKDDSKITTDHSLLLLKSNGSGEEGKADGCVVQSLKEESETKKASPSTAAIEGCENEANNDEVHDPSDEFQGKPDLNVSVASLTSYISTEQGWEGIELVRAPASHLNAAQEKETQPSAQVSSEDQKELMSRATAPSPANCKQRLRGCSPPILPGAKYDQPDLNDPLLSRLSKTPSSSSHTPMGDPAKTSSSVLTKTTTPCADMNDANTPIARMRNSHAEGLFGRTTTDPDGVVIATQDSSVLGPTKPATPPSPDDRPRPRVSFASIHKGPHYVRQERFPSPRLNKQGEDEAQRSSVLAEEVRRSRFAAYLRRRMIEYDEVDEGPRIDRHRNEIPRVLDPNTMCTSVESSFTTLVSKTETADEGDSAQPATYISRGRPKPDYDDDSDSESSYCTDSDEDEDEDDDDSSEEDDEKSSGYFMSFFTDDPDTARDSNNETLEAVAKWCEDIPIPTAPQLEDLLKVATDFGFSNQTMKVTDKPHSKDQEAFTDFVEELENEEPLDEERGTLPRGQESTLAVPPKSKAPQARKPELDSQTTLSADMHHECGVLTLQDFHELALMAAEAIATRTKQMKQERPMILRTNKRKVLKTNTSTDSIEAAWECVEHTVNDLESVTGKIPQQEKSNVQDRIKAKLEHIKKTQPQVYKVFLAKMAAAEKSGRKFDFHRDDMILKRSSASKEQTPDPRAKVETEPQREDLKAESEQVSAQTPRISVKVEVESSPTKPCPSWESFDGSPFKEPGIRPHYLSAPASTESPDDSSVFDDFKWLSSAKDSFASTVESFIDGPKKMSGPLRTKLAQYSKTQPNLYRMLLEKVNEGDTLKPMHQPVAEEAKAAGGSTASRSKMRMRARPIRSCNQANNHSPVEEGSQVEVTEADFAFKQEHGASASLQRQENASGMVPPNLQTKARVAPSLNVIVKRFSEEPTQYDVATADSCLQTNKPNASPHAQSTIRAPEQDLKMKPTIVVVKASTLGLCSEEESSHVKNQTLQEAQPKESTKQGSVVGDREPMLERELFPGVSNSQPKKLSLKTPDINRAGTYGAEEDPKRNFAKKIEFFTKGISPVHQQHSVASEAKEKVGTSRVGSRVSMFSATKERNSEINVGAKGQPPSSSVSHCTATPEEEKPNPFGEEYNSHEGCMAGVDRSKTPLSSNRSCQGNDNMSQEESKHELSSGTPVFSNRYETLHTRPPAIRSTLSTSKPKKPPQTPKSNVTLPNRSAPKPVLKQSSKPDTDNKPLPSPTTSGSQWETFEGSSFKGFVFQSLSGTTNEQADKGPGPAIDLQATFLDSILPAPPSFQSHNEMHGRRDPWDFSEAAGEQWEHFSPLSFDSNFTNWGLKDRPASSSVRRKPMARRTTKASPSSVAEI